MRAATGADLPGIMALERASFPDDAWSDDMMREELASPHGSYLVVERDGEVVGYGGVRVVGADADIQTIALAAAVRGHGDGRRLLRALLDLAAQRRAREVFLEVRADNPVAHGLYASEGFTELGRRPRYYAGVVDAVVMRLDLRAWAARTDAGAAEKAHTAENPDTPASAPGART